MGRYDGAVELLEEGPCRFFGHGPCNFVRTLVTDLHAVKLELEETLRRVSFALEQGSFWDILSSLFDDIRRAVSIEQDGLLIFVVSMVGRWLEALDEVPCYMLCHSHHNAIEGTWI